DDRSLTFRTKFQLYLPIVLLRDVKAPSNTHQAGSAVASTLYSRRFVLSRIPGISYFPGRCIQWNTGVVAFGRSEHAHTPILCNEGNPIAGEIDRRARFGGRRRLCRAAPSACLSVEKRGAEHNQENDLRKRQNPN